MLSITKDYISVSVPTGGLYCANDRLLDLGVHASLCCLAALPHYITRYTWHVTWYTLHVTWYTLHCTHYTLHGTHHTLHGTR